MSDVRLPKQLTDLTYRIIGICMEVHREIGPGFPEVYYQRALAIEFRAQRVPVAPQRQIDVFYKGHRVGKNFLDFVVHDQIILELKSVSQLADVHLFQVLKYLSATNLDAALLVNFGKAKLEYRRILPTLKWQEFRSNQRFRS